MDRPKQQGMATAGETLAGKIVSQRGGEDRALAAAFPADASEWLSGLVQQHLRRVFAVLYRIVGNRADAQDLSQEVFLKAFQRRHQLRDPERVLPWLLRIASNAAIDFQRARAVQRDPQPWSEELHSGPPGPSPEHLLVQQEREQRLHDALKVLSPKERAAIVLRDLEGMSGAEVARTLGCSQITVRTHIASARIKLRRFLSRKERPVKGSKEKS